MTTALAQVLWQSPGFAPVAVGLLAALAVAVIVLYPAQTRGVPPFWRWAMPVLRGMAVAALAVAVVQPVVLRPRTAARQGAVVVLVDRSHSMSVVDRDRTPAELVALGAGLGVVPAGARPEATPGLRARFDRLRSLADQLVRARSEAEYARVSGRGTAAGNARLGEATERLRAGLAELPDLPAPADLAQRVAELKRLPPALDDAVLRTMRTTLDAAGRALAASQAQADEQLFRQNDSIRSVCTALGARSREQLLEAGLTQPGGLLASLPAGAPVYGFAFTDDEDLRPLALTAGTAGARLDVDANGSRSDIAGAVRAAMNRTAGRAVQAMVVLSDGRQVGGDVAGVGGVEAIASDVSAAGVPIFAVQTSAPGQRRDVSIVAVAAPNSARVGQIIPVRVELRGPGFRAATVDVRLDAENVRQIQRVTIGDDASGVAEFQVQLSRSGPQALVAGVLPLDFGELGRAAGETSDENNRFERWIKVGGEPARVLIVAGPEPGRQYASVHAALSRCGWVSLREVEQDEVAALAPWSIEQQDVIVLIDVPPYDLGEAQWTAIERATRQRGASVIVCPGKHAPADYARHAWAARLLPYESSRAAAVSWRTWPAEEPQFRVVPSSNIDLAPAELEFWRQLPPVSRYVPLSSTVPPVPLLADARAMLIERQSGSAVLTEARRGMGRIYFLGTDQSWRWRGPAGGDEREQFWPQLARLAAGEPYAAVRDGMWLDADVVAPQPDQPFTVRARVYDLYGQPVESATQTLQVLRDGGTLVREVTMSSSGEGSGRYESLIATGLPAGQYTLRLEPGDDTSTEAASEPVELPMTVTPHLEAEMSDLSGDDRILRRIADASGGQFLTVDQFNTLPGRLAENRQKQSRLVEYALWDSPYLFGFVLACLSAEWALRKKFGLA